MTYVHFTETDIKEPLVWRWNDQDKVMQVLADDGTWIRSAYTDPSQLLNSADYPPVVIVEENA